MTKLDSRELRSVFGCFATGVTVITAEKDGELYGMTVNSFSSVSLDPPLVLWSLSNDGQSYDAFSTAEQFNIHILAENQDLISTQFAGSSSDKFDGTEYQLDENGIPLLKGCSAWIRCTTETSIEQGDHLVIVGKVIDTCRDDLAKPLIFSGGRYAKLADSY